MPFPSFSFLYSNFLRIILFRLFCHVRGDGMTLQLNCYDTSNIIYVTRELAEDEDEDDQEKNKRMECGWKRIRQKNGIAGIAAY